MGEVAKCRRPCLVVEVSLVRVHLEGGLYTPISSKGAKGCWICVREFNHKRCSALGDHGASLESNFTNRAGVGDKEM